MIAVYSKVLEVRDRVVRMRREMRMATTEEDVATMTLTAVHLDSSTRRATAFPEAVKSRLLALMG